MGSELHAGSLATHWVLVLNFKWFPRYASMNLSYFSGNSNGLGYSNPSDDQSSLPCAAADTLFLPCAQGTAAPLGSRIHGRTKPCILTRPQPTASASQIFTQLRSKAVGKVTDESEWEMHRKTPRRNSRQCPWLWKNSERGKDQLQNQATASTTLLGRIWPDNLKASTDSPISLPQVKHMYMQICLLDNKPELCSELCHSPVTIQQVQKSDLTSPQLMNKISSVFSSWLPSPDFVFYSFPLLYPLNTEFHVQALLWRTASAEAS